MKPLKCQISVDTFDTWEHNESNLFLNTPINKTSFEPEDKITI